MAKMTELEIREIVKQASQGDEVAIESLYLMYYRITFGVIMRIVENYSDAEDVNHNLWIHLIYKNQINGFLGNSQFKSWLYRCAINSAFMFLRSKKAWNNYFGSLEDIRTSQIEDSRILIDPRTLNQEQLIIENIALERALDQLTEKYRAILLLHDYHGFEHNEIAEQFRIHEGTSKSQAYKARGRMKRLLAV